MPEYGFTVSRKHMNINVKQRNILGDTLYDMFIQKSWLGSLQIEPKSSSFRICMENIDFVRIIALRWEQRLQFVWFGASKNRAKIDTKTSARNRRNNMPQPTSGVHFGFPKPQKLSKKRCQTKPGPQRYANHLQLGAS